ncbi:MAG TPA: glycosyltransferase family 87 protein [Candidatus Sulfotelmatobacter sp.]|nr:glycosyltransferase family 87 protein [Candidatus Sulfotelmatobacter sp.]
MEATVPRRFALPAPWLAASLLLGAICWTGIATLTAGMLSVQPAEAGFDLDLLLQAGRRVAAGLSPYDPANLVQPLHARDLFYSYPPVVAQLLSVVASLPLAALLLLWGIASVGGLLLVTEALRRRLAPDLSMVAALAPVLAAAPLVFPFSVALMFGNLDAWFPLVYGLVLLAALGAGTGTRVVAGIGLGTAVVAKLHPASLVVWLAIRGRRERALWVVLAATLAAGAVLVAVSVALNGWGPWADYLTVVQAEAGALILTPVNIGPAPQVAMLFGFSEGAARVLGALVAAGALGLTAWAAEQSRDVVTSLALAAVASLVILPITWYHYPLALMPFAIAAYLRARPAQVPAVRWLLGAAVLASLLAIVAPVAVWIAVALVLVAVARTAPTALDRVPLAAQASPA